MSPEGRANVFGAAVTCALIFALTIIGLIAVYLYRSLT